MRLAAIILDLDGTIADSVEMFYEFACEIAADLGLPPPEREVVFDLMRTGRSTLSTDLFPDVTPERITGAFQERGPGWLRRYHEETRPIDGSIEALRALREQGLTLGIATASGRDAPFLDRWGVRELFAAVVGREDVTQRKPSPEVILRCLERLGAAAESAIYVGDSPIDVQAGKAAGVGTVGVLSGASPHAVLALEQPDAILPGIGELPPLIDTWRDGRRS